MGYTTWKDQAFAQRPEGSPLSPHVKGWCKSIRGKLVIVAGKVPHGQAMEKYHLRMAAIITATQSGQPAAARTPAPAAPRGTGGTQTAEPPKQPPAAAPALATPATAAPTSTATAAARSITVQQLKDKFLAYKMALCKRGKLTPTAVAAIDECTTRFAKRYGDRTVDTLTIPDFTTYRRELEDHFTSPYSVQRHVTQTKAMLKWGADPEHGINARLPLWGKGFCNPSDSEKEKHRGKIRREYGLSLFEPAEIRKILASATAVERAIVLLGLNCAYGNNDLSSLTRTMLNLDSGVADYPRIKTGAERRAFLWPETISAVRAAIPLRPTPAKDEYGGLVFLTPTGLPWSQNYLTKKGKVSRSDEMTYLFKRLQEKAGTYKEKRGIYALRRTFDTAAAEIEETMARLRVMGHKLVGMDGHYVQRVKDSKIRAVCEHVRQHFLSAIEPPKLETVKVGEYELPELDLS